MFITFCKQTAKGTTGRVRLGGGRNEGEYLIRESAITMTLDVL